MKPSLPYRLLPEEDAVDEADEETDPDLTVPGDLWFVLVSLQCRGQKPGKRVVYSRPE